MLSARQILEDTGGAIMSAGEAFPLTTAQLAADVFFPAISIDSRTIGQGELFLALKGDRFDGHDYVRDALRTGAGAIVSNEWMYKSTIFWGGDKSVILVDDTLAALHALARSIRKRFIGRVISVVGSNGKTTTKELIASILGIKFKVLKTPGNLNNQIGMPLTITRVQDDTAIMVLEMGTNRPGDIDQLCAIGLPDTGVITNIGQEHLEGFGSLAAVRDSELELLPYVKKLIVNADDTFLMEGIENRFGGTIIPFGIEERTAEIRAEGIKLTDKTARFNLCTGRGNIAVESGLPGRFNIYNSLAAAAAAYAMDFDLGAIKKGLESFSGVPLRSEVRIRAGVVYINDAYNANPSSMEQAVTELVRRAKAGSGSGRAIAVLGDMLELGSYSAEAHVKLGALLSGLRVDILIGAGPLMALAVEAFRGTAVAAADAKDAGRELKKIVREGDVVLVKGSRAMRMEDALEEN